MEEIFTRHLKQEGKDNIVRTGHFLAMIPKDLKIFPIQSIFSE